MQMIRPDYKEFLRLSRRATLVPVAKSISADLLTPVSAFLAVAEGEPDAFLLESVEGGEKIGRYTFLGVRPFLRLESCGAEITIEARGPQNRAPHAETFSQSSKNFCSSIVPRKSKACRHSPRAQSDIAPMTSCGASRTSESTPPTTSTFPTAC